MVKTELKSLPQYNWVRGGLSMNGSPPNINLVRSFRKALSRRIALGTSKREKIRCAEERLNHLDSKWKEYSFRRQHLKNYILYLKSKIIAIPFLDTSDVLYHRVTRELKASSQAVMFCIMDVSGSMDDQKKDMAKRFFILLYLFLTKTYQEIKIVFIRHHTTAKDVDEQEFFYSRETGGTVVSSALELTYETILKKYPTSDWNIYVAQASDGDNWNADSPHCQSLLEESIMPLVQYYAYVEIMPRHHQSLWHSYLQVKKTYPNFSMETISKLSEIFSVFYDLFRRKSA